MASCSQVNSLFQAHIDGELGRSEKRILDEHLHECAACRAEMDRQKACTTQVFEALSDQRLMWGLRSRVLAHLPEMDPALRQGSHPTDPRFASRKTRGEFPWLVLGAAALLVLFATAFLYAPTQSAPGAAVPMGMVTFNDGSGVLRTEPGDEDYDSVALKSLVVAGERYETLDDGRLALALVGGSMVKVNHDSALTVVDNRRVTVEHGLTFFDIGRDRRHFYVETPTGEIMVFGTAFLVDVSGETTTVTVTEGDILVENSAGKTAVSRGNQVAFTRNDPMPKPRAVDTAPLMAWADAIVPDPGAMALFLETLEQRTAANMAIAAEPVYAVGPLKGRMVEEFILTWVPDSVADGHCSYTLYVTDTDGQLRMLDSIDGAVFDDPNRAQITITVPDAPIQDVDVLHIKLIPDYSTGDAEVEFVDVSAVATWR